MRKIVCCKCYKWLGEIANGSKLHKKIVYLCDKCYDEMKPKTNSNPFGDVSGLKDIFGGFTK